MRHIRLSEIFQSSSSSIRQANIASLHYRRGLWGVWEVGQNYIHRISPYDSLSTSLTQSSSMSMSMYSPYSSPVSSFHLFMWCALLEPLFEPEPGFAPPWLVFASSSCCILLCFVRLFWNHTLTWNQKEIPSDYFKKWMLNWFTTHKQTNVWWCYREQFNDKIYKRADLQINKWPLFRMFAGKCDLLIKLDRFEENHRPASTICKRYGTMEAKHKNFLTSSPRATPAAATNSQTIKHLTNDFYPRTERLHAKITGTMKPLFGPFCPILRRFRHDSASLPDLLSRHPWDICFEFRAPFETKWSENARESFECINIRKK